MRPNKEFKIWLARIFANKVTNNFKKNKIMNSKIEARIEAVKLAINVEGVTSENIISTSEAIYGFILGDAKLPENHDANAEMKELMAKMLPTASALSTTANPMPDEKESDSEATEKA